MYKLSKYGIVVLSALVLVLAYDILASVVVVIPHPQFLSDGVIQALAGVVVAFIAKDFIDEKQIVSMIDKGDFVNVPAIMSALQKTNEERYKKVMRNYRQLLERRIKEYTESIQFIREDAERKFRKTGKLNFNVRNESERLYNDQSELEILNRIESGDYSWEKLYKDALQDAKKAYVLRYELGKMDDEEKQTIDREVEHCKRMISGGIIFKIKENGKVW